MALFTSALSVSEFSACLHGGMRPLGWVQGSCVVNTFASVVYRNMSNTPNTPNTFPGFARWNKLAVYECPHGRSSATHVPGANYEEPNGGWALGFEAARQRMVDQARRLGAHAVIGVTDAQRLYPGEVPLWEFTMSGTAVAVEGQDPPETPWTSYLAGPRLAKLVDSGFVPVSVVAARRVILVVGGCVMASMRVAGDARSSSWPVQQLADARMQAQRMARSALKADLGTDTLHGADVALHHERDHVSCVLKGTRVRRFKPADPLKPPIPTVHLR